MVGDRMAGRFNQRRKETCQDGDALFGLTGVRAFVVALKPGNAGGAKGCREMEWVCNH